MAKDPTKGYAKLRTRLDVTKAERTKNKEKGRTKKTDGKGGRKSV
jgi:hypothetical protein